MGFILCRMVQHVLAENQATPYATVQNRAGKWVLPQQANWTGISDELTLPSSVASPDWISVVLAKSRKWPSVHVSQALCCRCLFGKGVARYTHTHLLKGFITDGGAESANAYPLAGFSFMIVNKDSKYMGAHALLSLPISRGPQPNNCRVKQGLVMCAVLSSSSSQRTLCPYMGYTDLCCFRVSIFGAPAVHGVQHGQPCVPAGRPQIPLCRPAQSGACIGVRRRSLAQCCRLACLEGCEVWC